MFGYTKPCRANACMAALSVDRVLAAALSLVR
jgi:hypothetical protein